jgi:hypothetical protein
MAEPLSELRFEYEWEPAPGVGTPELAATWARLEISVGGSCVTRVEDPESRSTRRSLYCSLYPLAEWIAFNWWLLSANQRPARELHVGGLDAARWRGLANSGWRANHNLRGANDGFHWPDLLLAPEGSRTRVLWQPDRTPSGDRVRFLDRGDVLVDRDGLLAKLAGVVESVLTRLEEADVGDSALVDEWRAIQGVDPEVRAFCIAAARLGQDPYSVPDSLEKAILRAADVLQGTLLDDFLDSIAPGRIEEGLAWVEQVAREVRQDSEPLAPEIQSLRSEGRGGVSVSDGLSPWGAGYDLARRARAVLEIPATDRVAMDGMMSVDVHESADALLGLGGETARGGAGLRLGKPLPVRHRRFAEARALWHFGYGDPGPDFLLTGGYGDHQKEERAFAAELLAPVDGIVEVLGGKSAAEIDTADVEEVADHFRVSEWLVSHQIDNQLLAA